MSKQDRNTNKRERIDRGKQTLANLIFLMLVPLMKQKHKKTEENKDRDRNKETKESKKEKTK